MSSQVEPTRETAPAIGQRTAAAIARQSWYTNVSARFVLDELTLPSWLAGVFALVIYWGLPLGMSFIDGTLISVAQSQELNAALAGPRPLQSVLAFFLLGAKTDNSQFYLLDRSHFLFSVLTGLGAAVAVSILRRLGSAPAALYRRGLPVADADFLSRNEAFFRALGNHPLGRIASLILASGVFLVFFYFYRNPGYHYWWGSDIHGRAGLVLAAVEFVMVYFATQSVFLILAGAAMIAGMFQKGVELRPFLADRCNGLGPIGNLILMLWLIALIGAMAVYVTMGLGYLGIERMPIAWALALVATLVIPFVAIVPLVATVRATLRARDAQLRRIEDRLDERYAKAIAPQAASDNASDGGDDFGQLKEIYEFLCDLNIWPFNPRALTVIILAYALQAYATIREFVGQGS